MKKILTAILSALLLAAPAALAAVSRIRAPSRTRNRIPSLSPSM